MQSSFSAGMDRLDRPLLLLHSDSAFEERVAVATRRGFSLKMVDAWDVLGQALRSAPPVTCVVVDPCYGTGASRAVAPQLRHLTREFPLNPILVALEEESANHPLVLKLGGSGIDHVISISEDDASAILKRLMAARETVVESLLASTLPSQLGSRERRILIGAGEIASAGGGVTELARMFYASQRTLLRWCDEAQLPPPRQILGWMRALFAAAMLDDSSRSVESIAYACGYAAGSGLRRTLKDLSGLGPRELRRRGAAHTISKAFHAALRGRTTNSPGARTAETHLGRGQLAPAVLAG